nr:hypothetical protein [Tanacetum cinerariifolium]
GLLSCLHLYQQTTFDIRYKSVGFVSPQETSSEDQLMDEDSIPDEQVHLSDDKDIENDHIPEATALVSTYAHPVENSLLVKTGDMSMFIDWYCKRRGITKLTRKDLEGPAYELVKVFHPNVVHLQFLMEECHKLLTDQMEDALVRVDISRPLSLGGPPGHVTIQTGFFFNKDLDYLRYGSKGCRPALSISKMKATYYPKFRLEQMVPEHMWIESKCMYDIATSDGISHWWLQRQRFYIDRHTTESGRKVVRTHMRILSVVRIEVYSIYGDFEDLYLLNLQGHLDHLPPNDKKILFTAVNLWTGNLVIRQRVGDFQIVIESYQTQLNLTKPRWDATGFKFKHNYTVIDSSRSVTFQDRNDTQKIMRFNEIHKFSDNTLQRIEEALDYRVKEFNMNTRFWTEKDVARRVVLGRSFMRLTKGIADFGNGVIKIYAELDPFLDSSEETENTDDDWDILNNRKQLEKYQLIYSDMGPSLSTGKPLTQEEAAREALAIDICKRF